MTPVPQPVRQPILDELGTPTRPWVAFFNFIYLRLQALAAEIAAIPVGTAGDRAWLAVTAGATESFLCNAYRGYVVTLTGDTTIDPPTTPTEGKSVLLIFVQDSTGGHSVTWDAGWNIPAGITIGSAANAVTAVLVEFGPSGVAYVVSDRNGGGSGGGDVIVAATGVSGTITPDHSAGTVFIYEIDGDCTLDTPSGLVDEKRITVKITQDATGGHAITFDPWWGDLRDYAADPEWSTIVYGIILSGNFVYLGMETNGPA